MVLMTLQTKLIDGPAANTDKQRAHLEVLRRKVGAITEVGSARDPQRLFIRFGDTLEQWDRLSLGFYELVRSGRR